MAIASAAALGAAIVYKRRHSATAVYTPRVADHETLHKVAKTAARAKRAGVKIDTIVEPHDAGAPPLDSAGHLGHTGIPGNMFWGLPMNVIWMVEDAYRSGKTSRIAASAKVVDTQGFNLLAQMLRDDVAKRGLD